MSRHFILIPVFLIIASIYSDVVSSEKPPTVLANTEEYPKNCQEVQNERYNTSGFYYIQPQSAPKPFLVFCNMEISGGGWTTILNRVDGSQDFYRDWNDYKSGFGHVAGEFWLGLEKIYYMAGYELTELLFELVDWDDARAEAHYDYFGIGGEEEGYVLKLVDGFSGTAGDSFTHQAGMKFSTNDRDQDMWPTENCAESSAGGWWYRDCKTDNPTGQYFDSSNGTDNYYVAITWDSWHGFEYCLKEIRMMIRPKVK